MIVDLLELVGFALYLTVLAAWRALPLLAVVLILDWVLRNRISARVHCWLWLLVLARLVMPVTIPSAISLTGLMEQAMAPVPASQDDVDEFRPRFETVTREDGRRVTVPILPADATADQAALAYQRAETMTPRVRRQAADKSLHAWLVEAVVAVSIFGWFAVAIGLVITAVIRHLRFQRVIRRSATVTDPVVLERLSIACDKLGLARMPRVKETAALAAPAVFGVWYPVICLPPVATRSWTREDIDLVLRHELAHIKRRDALAICIATLIRSIHWWNPIAWIATSKLRNYVEQAVDELATRHLNRDRVADYSELLLRFANQQRGQSPQAVVGLLSMASVDHLRRRITRLQRGPGRHPRLVEVGMIPLVIITAAAGLTDASTAEPSAEPSPDGGIADLRGRDGISVAPPEIRVAGPQPDEELVTIELNVADAIAKAERLQPGIDASKFLRHYLVRTPDPVDVTVTDGVLRATLPKGQAAEVRRMLRAFERSGAPQVTLEVRVFTNVDLRLAQDFDWTSQHQTVLNHRTHNAFDDPIASESDAPWPVADSPLLVADAVVCVRPAFLAKIDGSQRYRFLNRCQDDSRANIMQTPKVTMFNGQIGFIQMGVQRPFVTSVRFAEQGQVVEPVIDVLDEGMTMRASLCVTEDGSIDLSCLITESSIDSVGLATLPFRSPATPSQPIRVQVPKIDNRSMGTSIRLARSESLLIASPRTYEAEDVEEPALATFYMLTPRLLEDSERMMLASFVPDECSGDDESSTPQH